MTAELLVLRLVHILGGTFWVGTALFTSFFLLPTLAAAGPAAAPIMAGLRQRHLMLVLPIAALLTILSGLRLLMIASAGFDPAYFRSTIGSTFSISGGLAIVAFLIGFTVVRPATARAGMLGAQLANADEAARSVMMADMQKLRGRAASANAIVVALLLIATAGMAVARYLG